MIRRRSDSKDKETFKFADIHCHALYGMDDGSLDEGMSIRMLKIAEAEGIDSIILTPHFIIGANEFSAEDIRKKVDLLQEKCRAEGVSVSLYPGAEFFYVDNAHRYLEKHRIPTLNGTNRLLVEFEETVSDAYILDAAKTIIEYGYVPVIAHVERYRCMAGKIDDIRRLKEIGVEIQVNAAPIAGKRGIPIRNFILKLIEAELVDYIGTDAHRDTVRAPEIRKCMQILMKRVETEYLREITYLNTKSLMEI